MFLQASCIPLTFTNVSHTPTPLKESLRITLPTHISKENNDTACTQTAQPTLGFTLAEIRQAQNEPTLTIPQLLKIKPCKDYTKTPLQTLDGLYVTFYPFFKRQRNKQKSFRRKKSHPNGLDSHLKKYCGSHL